MSKPAMNANVRKVYDLLMSGPEWFDMRDHRTCILGAACRIDDTLGHKGFVNTWEAYKWFGLSATRLQDLCLDSGAMSFIGPAGARRAAKLLKSFYEDTADV